MSRRIDRLRFVRPSRRHTSGIAGAVLLIGWFTGAGLVSPASAEEEISVQPDELVFGEPGSVTTVATEQVPEELVGKSCALRVVAENGSSVHPGNTLIVSTGDSRTVITGVEDSPDGSVIGTAQVVLAATITFQLEMGSDGMSSLGFAIGFDCPEPVASTEASSTAPPPTVLPAQQEAPSTTAAPAADLPEAPPAESTVGRPSFTG